MSNDVLGPWFRGRPIIVEGRRQCSVCLTPVRPGSAAILRERDGAVAHTGCGAPERKREPKPTKRAKP